VLIDDAVASKRGITGLDCDRREELVIACGVHVESELELRLVDSGGEETVLVLLISNSELEVGVRESVAVGGWATKDELGVDSISMLLKIDAELEMELNLELELMLEFEVVELE